MQRFGDNAEIEHIGRILKKRFAIFYVSQFIMHNFIFKLVDTWLIQNIGTVMGNPVLCISLDSDRFLSR